MNKKDIPHQRKTQLYSPDEPTPYQLPLHFWALDRWEGGESVWGGGATNFPSPPYSPPDPKSGPASNWSHQVGLSVPPSPLGEWWVGKDGGARGEDGGGGVLNCNSSYHWSAWRCSPKMCSAVPPALSCPPASWVWRAAARIRGGGGGDAGREGGGRGGKGGGEDGAERRGGAAAATGSPDCVSSPTRMSSSGEEDQAVHGSSAPPAAAAQTVAVPHTGLGNCRLRGAQCACAAPAVAVPPVLLLKLLLSLLPPRRSPGRGLSISPAAPRPEAGEREESAQALAPSPSQPRSGPLYGTFLSCRPSPPLARSWDHGCPAEPNFCRAVRPVAAPLSPEIQTNVRCPMGPWSGNGKSRQGARESNGQSEGGSHLSLSRRGPEPRLLPRTQLSGRRCRSAPAPAEAERGAGTDWAARGDAEPPPDAATAPLRASAPEAQRRSCQPPPCPTPRSCGWPGSARRAGAGMAPAPPAAPGARRRLRAWSLGAPPALSCRKGCT